MSFSRLVPHSGRVRLVVLPVQCARFSHQSASATPVAEQRPEEMDNPSFIQKIILRFKGIPLKGETHPPKSMFRDVDKEWFAPEPLPELPKNFKEHPDRDLVNFPYPTRPMYPPKTRFLVIPDSWMTPFHKVTGVSGPYLFFGGLFAFLVNKEIWVFEEQGHMLCGWILFYLLLSRTIGYRLDNWLYGEYQNKMKFYKDLIQEDLKEAVKFRKTSVAETASFAAVKESFPTVFKENMALQLEATYRKNVKMIATEVKRRIDYLQETEAANKRFEREHMLKWITKSVLSEIESNKEGIKDKYLSNCISQLKNLSTAK